MFAFEQLQTALFLPFCASELLAFAENYSSEMHGTALATSHFTAADVFRDYLILSYAGLESSLGFVTSLKLGKIIPVTGYLILLQNKILPEVEVWH